MAYMISGNMDSGASEFQIEAAISKIFASVSNRNVHNSIRPNDNVVFVVFYQFALGYGYFSALA